MDWSVVDYLWIIVMFLSAVWTLILTAPIHCRGSIAEQVIKCYISPNLFWWRNKLIYVLDDLRGSRFSANWYFRWTTPLRHLYGVFFWWYLRSEFSALSRPSGSQRTLLWEIRNNSWRSGVPFNILIVSFCLIQTRRLHKQRQGFYLICLALKEQFAQKRK